MNRSFCTIMLLLAVFAELPAEDNYLYHQIQATVLVADAEKTGERISRWAEQSGGYVLRTSTDRLIFRFPYTEIASLRSFLEEVAEYLVDLSPQAVDLRESILGLQSGIRSREEILEKNLSYIDRTDTEGTLAIEREVLQLLGEIEQFKGKLRKLNTDRRFARAEVFLRFMEQSLPSDIPSSFAWINTVDFYSFMQEGL